MPAGTGVFAPGKSSWVVASTPARGRGTRKKRASKRSKKSKHEEERRRREQWERRQQQYDLDLLDPPITIVAAQLQHRVPCWGYALSMTELKARGKGGEGEGGGGGESGSDDNGDESDGDNGEEESDEAAEQASSSSSAASPYSTRKVVILGDTCDSSAMAAVARDADLLSHEATFSEKMFDKAKIAQHSTAAMAGAFAAECGAKKLVLTHFSARYPDQGMERLIGGNGYGGRGGGGGRFGGRRRR